MSERSASPLPEPAPRRTLRVLRLVAVLGGATLALAALDWALLGRGAEVRGFGVGRLHLFGGWVLAAAGWVALGRASTRVVAAWMVALLGCSALFVLLGADVVALAQALVLGGGVAGLVVFAVQLGSGGAVFPDHSGPARTALASVAGVGLAALLAVGIAQAPWLVEDGPLRPTTATALGELLLGADVFPFELAGALLLVAVVGAGRVSRFASEGPAQEGR